jgi:hypothetical protein
MTSRRRLSSKTNKTRAFFVVMNIRMKKYAPLKAKLVTNVENLTISKAFANRDRIVAAVK